MTTIRLECHNDEENAHKYYEIEYLENDNVVTVRYGRCPGYGRSGTMVVRTMARYRVTKKLQEKYRKGYTHIATVETSVADDIENTSVPLPSEPLPESGLMVRLRRLGA